MSKYKYLPPKDTKAWIDEMVREEVTVDMLDQDLEDKADEIDGIALDAHILLDDDAIREALHDRRRRLQNEAYDLATEEH